MGFDNLGDILKKIRSKHPVLSKRLAEAEAVSRWDAAVGPMIAKHARATKVVRGELWVEVDHPIWRTELHHKKRQILETLNREIRDGDGDSEPIQDIFFVDPRNSTRE